MFDKSYGEECIRETAEYNKVWKLKKKLDINPFNLGRQNSFS